MHKQIQAVFLSALLSLGLSAQAQIQTKRQLVVNLQSRKLALLEDGQVKKTYVVAVGKESTPSPTGTFTIISRVSNPTYSHHGKMVAPGPGNPVGTRWMGLSVKGYGIHGTNAPQSIGTAASHGCIRMNKRDLEELFDVVRAGDEVKIVGAPDAETATIFVDPAAAGAESTGIQTVLAATDNTQTIVAVAPLER